MQTTRTAHTNPNLTSTPMTNPIAPTTAVRKASAKKASVNANQGSKEYNAKRKYANKIVMGMAPVDQIKPVNVLMVTQGNGATKKIAKKNVENTGDIATREYVSAQRKDSEIIANLKCVPICVQGMDTAVIPAVIVCRITQEQTVARGNATNNVTAMDTVQPNSNVNVMKDSKVNIATY